MNHSLIRKNYFWKICAETLFLVFVLLNLHSENINIIHKPSGLYRVGETMRLTIEIPSQKEATQFILSKMEGPSVEKIKLVDSSISVTSKMDQDKPVLVYHFDFLLQASERGTASIAPIKFTFMNAKGEKQDFSSAEIQFEIVSWTKRYRGRIFSLLLLGTGGVIVLSVRRKVLRSRKQQEAREKIIRFKLIKIEKEKESKEQLKSLSQFLVEGDYDQYALGILNAITHYFQGCLALKLPAAQAEMKKELLAILPHEFHNKINHLFDLLELIRFTNQKPQPADLERVQVLAKELIAEHREKGEIIP
ncbi:MAG: hypothetical protein JW774_04140 [Candidatus Aureabacteria bacterium]|nr:hypothetical protein [Candidatus Auribacterota bacterium]